MGDNADNLAMTEQDKPSYRFWEQKRLSQMTHDEWESLCDGCGRCCLHKLEDADNGDVFYTKAACDLFDITQCRCQDYAHRTDRVAGCVELSVKQAQYFNWLPPTCAYRLLAEGEGLPWWHPLISGTTETVIKAGVSIRDIAQPLSEIDELQDAVVLLSEPTITEPE